MEELGLLLNEESLRQLRKRILLKSASVNGEKALESANKLQQERQETASCKMQPPSNAASLVRECPSVMMSKPDLWTLITAQVYFQSITMCEEELYFPSADIGVPRSIPLVSEDFTHCTILHRDATCNFSAQFGVNRACVFNDRDMERDFLCCWIGYLQAFYGRFLPPHCVIFSPAFS